jgi:transketolase
MGIAEQNMLAFAGGMARKGLIPLIHTFAVFIYRRAFDLLASGMMEAIAASRYGALTLENHSIPGGLGSIVSECMAESGIGKPLRHLGLRDTFVHGASRRYLMRKYGLDAMALIAAIEDIAGKAFGIEESSLRETYTPAVHSAAKAEAL